MKDDEKRQSLTRFIGNTANAHSKVTELDVVQGLVSQTACHLITKGMIVLVMPIIAHRH
jgi:hypothetical protein